VIAYGEFELISNGSKKDQVLEEIYKEFPEFTPVEAKLDARGEDRETIVFQIVIKQVTGVRETS
jgi:hypothetical protein